MAQKMIQKITAINTGYSGLEVVLPQGHEFDTDSGLVLVVGPNFSGKTAILRLLDTSLQFNRYFKENGVSKWFEEYKLDKLEHLLDNPSHEHVFGGMFANIFGPITKEPTGDPILSRMLRAYLPWARQQSKRGWFHCQEGEQTFNFLLSDSRFNFSPNDFKVGPYSLILTPDFVYDTQLYLTFVSTTALKKLSKVPNVLKQKTDLNVWGYIKPTIAGRYVYTQFSAASFGHVEKQDFHIGRRKYTYFDPSYDGRTTEQNHPIESGYASCVDGKSPGIKTMTEIDTFFSNIDNFFKMYINPLWKGQLGAFEMHADRPSTEKVPKDSHLVVFMDEPTAYLDYQNRHKFLERVNTVLQKYGPRLQFFIATNDGALIENATGCRYLSLYSQPAQSLNNVEQLKQTLGLR